MAETNSINDVRAIVTDLYSHATNMAGFAPILRALAGETPENPLTLLAATAEHLTAELDAIADRLERFERAIVALSSEGK